MKNCLRYILIDILMVQLEINSGHVWHFLPTLIYQPRMFFSNIKKTDT